jgi:hypothetical protein
MPVSGALSQKNRPGLRVGPVGRRRSEWVDDCADSARTACRFGQDSNGDIAVRPPAYILEKTMKADVLVFPQISVSPFPSDFIAVWLWSACGLALNVLLFATTSGATIAEALAAAG